MLPKLPQIALFYDATIVVQRLAVSGVMRYVNTCTPWCVTLNESHAKPSVPTDCAGILACAPHVAELKALKRLRLPMVLINLSHLAASDRALTEGLCHVENDTKAVGVRAAEFFLSHPRTTYAYVGRSDAPPWDTERESAFVARLAEVGETAAVYPRPAPTLSATLQQAHLRDWIASLPKPMSIFAANDARAHQVLNACLQANVTVPYEAAILGVDNDAWVCEATLPRLSSLAVRADEGGFEAARLLDQLIRHVRDPQETPAPPEVRLMPPGEIVTRESTDFRRVTHPAVSRALAFIQATKGLNVRVSDVADAVRHSSGWTERLFQKELGTSIIEEISRVRMKTVLELIRTTDTPFNEIAKLSGFTNASTLCRLIKKETGLTMSALRET